MALLTTTDRRQITHIKILFQNYILSFSNKITYIAKNVWFSDNACMKIYHFMIGTCRGQIKEILNH